MALWVSRILFALQALWDIRCWDCQILMIPYKIPYKILEIRWISWHSRISRWYVKFKLNRNPVLDLFTFGVSDLGGILGSWGMGLFVTQMIWILVWFAWGWVQLGCRYAAQVGILIRKTCTVPCIWKECNVGLCRHCGWNYPKVSRKHLQRPSHSPTMTAGYFRLFQVEVNSIIPPL